VGILKAELEIKGSILQNSAIARVPWAFAYVFFWLAFYTPALTFISKNQEISTCAIRNISARSEIAFVPIYGIKQTYQSA
jgi:hypothetical protein